MRLDSCRRLAMALGIAFMVPAVGGAESVDGLAEGVMAQPLERKRPRYPKTQASKGQEGWVQVSFVISPDGTTQDLLVEDSSGSGEFERPALAAMKRWRYKPATLGGEPVQQCHTRVQMIFALEQGRRGASARFITRFKAATRQGGEADLESLKSAIDRLAPRNLYENAYTSYLSAIVARREHDPDSQLMHLRRVIMSDGEYTQPDIYVGALETLFGLEASSGRYRNALWTYQRLLDSSEKSNALNELGKVAEQIQTLIDGDSRLSRHGELGPRRDGAEEPVVWSHWLSRRVAGLDEIEGELDHVELRCDFHRAIAKPKADRALRMPKDWGSCVFYVFGEPGARFRLVEYADSEFPSEQLD